MSEANLIADVVVTLLECSYGISIPDSGTHDVMAQKLLTVQKVAEWVEYHAQVLDDGTNEEIEFAKIIRKRLQGNIQ